MRQPEAAVAIVHTRSSPESVLLMRRSERPEDSWSGQWSLPGGRCDAGDRDAVHTALRELDEECGIRLAGSDLERALPHTIARRKTPPYLVVAPFVFRVPCALPTTLDPREAVEALWISVETLRDAGQHALQPVPGRPREMLFPTVELKGAPLWGFTYRLLTDWARPAPDGRLAGIEVANDILDFLHSLGVRIAATWTELEGVPTVTVDRAIPADAVLAQFAGTGLHVASMNTLEVRPDRIRLLGPEWEEYRIHAAGNF